MITQFDMQTGEVIQPETSATSQQPPRSVENTALRLMRVEEAMQIEQQAAATNQGILHVPIDEILDRWS